MVFLTRPSIKKGAKGLYSFSFWDRDVAIPEGLPSRNAGSPEARHQLRLLPAGAQAQAAGVRATDDPRLTTLPPYGAQVKGRKGAIDLP